MDTRSPAAMLVPELSAFNRLPMRPALDPYPDVTAALRGSPSPGVRSLDGVWKFRLVDGPDLAPRGWTDPTHDVTGWRDIAVPGCWTRQDVGDLPHYTNVVMPWPDDPPGFPDRNPTGLYRRDFSLPAGWSERRTVLRLGGFESAAFVWCNGELVGMGKDSRLASEFDVTTHVRRGTNTLAVMVVRWSDATWIEDQDHWFNAGLHRSVSIYSTDHRYLADVATISDYDPATGAGRLSVRVTVGGADPSGWKVRARLLGERRRVVARREAPVATLDGREGIEGVIAAHVYPGPHADLVVALDEVRPWSAESPARYRLGVELIDPGGRVVEACATWIGFTRVEVRDRSLLVNGEPVMIAGVNRHDHHCRTAKTLTVDDMRRDVELMKRHNVNAVRTSHYPNDPAFLDLCDEYGLYVVDEANVESHARQQSLLADPRWHDAVEERVRRMVARDRNHPCVIGWSLGNESGSFACHDAAAAWIRRTDPSRFVHYEGALEWVPAGDLRVRGDSEHTVSPTERRITDIVCPMYASIDEIVARARRAESMGDDRPIILCEYSHAMGNSNGSLAEYWDAFWTEPGLQGGFVWDWIDQGLEATDALGRAYWAYGGHFGDTPNDANFCCNGLVGPDRAPHPALRELQWCARPVEITSTDASGRRLTVRNRRSFADLADLQLTWQLSVDGEPVAEGPLDVGALAAGEAVTVRPALPARRRAGEAMLTVTASLRRATRWAPAGHVVAWDQVAVGSGRPRRPRAAGRRSPARAESSEVTIRRDGERFQLRAGSWSVEGDLSTGALGGFSIARTNVVVGDLVPTLWRAPTDNDGVAQGWMSTLAGVRPRWVAWGLDRLEWVVDDVELSRRGEAWFFHRRGRLVGPDASARVELRLAARPGRELEVRSRFDVPDVWTDLPRVGLRFDVAAGFDRLRWYGPGPDETYPDRRSAATVGVWSSAVADQYHPYVVPQEHGCHVDARWFELRDRRGRAMRVAGDHRLIFSARHHRDQQLTEAATTAELCTSDLVEVHVDLAMRGLGTGACGPDVREPYLVRPGRHLGTWTIA